MQVSVQLRPAAGQRDDLSGLVHGHGQAMAGMPQLEWRGLQHYTISGRQACFPCIAAGQGWEVSRLREPELVRDG